MNSSLYDTVKALPILDYHNHLSMDDIRSNRRYSDIFDVWVKPDPYKHRAMRMCGVPERCITGDGTAFEKFSAWCGIFPKLVGNPLYVWSKNELRTVFGITETPCADNAAAIYEKANAYLQTHDIRPTTLLEQFHVELACPCTSLTDDVSAYEASDLFVPSLRGDDIVSVSLQTVQKLEALTGIPISCLQGFEQAVAARLDVFQAVGCRFADHALDNEFRYLADDGQNDRRFLALLNGSLAAEEKKALESYILTYLGSQYARLGFVLQLHIGAERFTSTRLRKLAGPAGGFAGIGNSVHLKSLITFLDTLDLCPYGLPKTMLFTLNPADNAAFSVLSGSFSKDNVAGLITQGPAWWWCDHRAGIWDVLENTAAFGLLSNFVGMTTDSRSLLSFSRHDYFRRLLCEFLEKKYESHELQCSLDELKAIAYDMCYGNAKNILRGVPKHDF